VNEGKGKVHSNYQMLEQIGQGGFGEVWKVRHKPSGDIRAMKIVKVVGDSLSQTNIANELEILK